MNVSFTYDDEDNQLLAIYVSIREGKVSSTIEIEPDAILADEDEDGNLLGVELLAPNQLTTSPKLRERYQDDAKRAEELLRETQGLVV